MKSFQTWTPRVRRLIYDALIQDAGCQDITGRAFAATLPFERICTAPHDTTAELFNRSDKIAYATGPLNTGNPPPWSTAWTAWIATKGVRVAKVPFIELPSDGLGAPSSFFDNLNPLPVKVTLGFTSLALLGIAIQYDAGNIQVKWFKDVDGNYGDEIFPGVSPAMFGNATLYASATPGETDLVLYYLRPALPKTIFARFEREGFLVEHVINVDLPVPLSKLIGSEAIEGRHYLYALDSIGRDVTLRTGVYAVKIAGDKLKLSAAVARGTYRQSAIPATSTGDKVKLKIAIVSGAYSDVIVEPPVLSGDQVTLTVAFESGEYA